MPWESSRRRKDPPHWSKLRQIVLERALGMCEHTQVDESPHGTTTTRCTYPAQDVDHKINLASGGTDELDNLQALCDWHHKRKTQQEARAARPVHRERRGSESHPGLVE